MALALIVWYGGRQVMWTGITLGTLVAFIQYTQRFFRPLSDLSREVRHPAAGHGLGRAHLRAAGHAGRPGRGRAPAGRRPAAARPRTGRRRRVGRRQRGRRAPTRPGREPRPGMRVEFDHVVVRLRRRALGARGRDASRSSRASAWRIVGPDRLGQDHAHEPAHALLRAAARRDPGGRPAARATGIPAQLRRRIGLVLQDVFLFSGTVEGNLTLGDPGSSPEPGARSRARGARRRRWSSGCRAAIDGRGPRARARRSRPASGSCSRSPATLAPRPRAARARRGHLERGHPHRSG